MNINATNRPARELYYLEMAKTAASRSTCLKRHYGAVIVKDDEIISTGYNGAPRGTYNCNDVGQCLRDLHKVPPGRLKYHPEHCSAVHSVQNAIISAARSDMLYSSIYIYGWDIATQDMVKNQDLCISCKRMVINAGIEEVIFADKEGICFDKSLGYGYRIVRVADWIANYKTIVETELEEIYLDG